MPNALLDSYRKSLADQGITDDRDDFFIMRDELFPLVKESPEILEKFPDFAAEFRQYREQNSPGTLGGLKNTLQSAYDRSAQGLNAIGGIGGSDAEDIASRERTIQSRPSSVPWEDWQNSSGKDAVKVFLRDPVEITSNIVAAGLGGSVPAIAGGLAGGAAGLAAGPVGGAIGAAVGTGSGSLATEYGNKYLEVLREAGADLSDAESIERVIQDPEVIERARDLGLKRGIPVAIFDAASAGIAGKFLKGVRAATTAQNIRRGLTEAGIQGGLGGAGEVAGALSASEEIKPGSVFEEIIGEIGPGAIEVGGTAARRSLVSPPAVEQASPIVPAPTSVLNQIPPVPIEEGAGTPVEEVPRTNAQMFAEVDEMTPEMKGDRLTELQAKESLTPLEEAELELLAVDAPTQIPTQGTTDAITEQPGVLAEPVVDEAPVAAIEEPPAQVPARTLESIRSDMQPTELSAMAQAAPISGSEFEAIGQMMEKSNADAATARADNTGLIADISGEDITPPTLPAPQAQPVVAPPAPPEAPKVRKPESTFFYALQQPVEVNGRTIPGYLQIDEVVDGKNTRSSNLQTLAKEGVNLPVPPAWLPTGNYTMDQITAAIAQGPAPTAVPSASAPSPQAFTVPAEIAAPTITKPAIAKELKVAAIAEAPKPMEVPSVVPATAVPAPAMGSPEAAAQTLQKPAPVFNYGPIIQGGPSIDFSTLTKQPDPAQWESAIRANLSLGKRGDKEGKRSLTRVGIALKRPNSEEVIFTGVTVPQRINKSTGGTEIDGLAVQRMGVGQVKRSIKAGGDQPALLREVVESGYSPIAVIHFEGEPTNIFQEFKTSADFNAAWDASGRATAPAINVPVARSSPFGGANVVPDSALPVSQIKGLSRIEAEIDRISRVWQEADRAGNKAEVSRLMNRYGELALKQEQAMRQNQTQTGDIPVDLADLDAANRVRRERDAQRLPIDAARAQQFSSVVERLRSQGGKVDLFAQEFFRQGTKAYINQAIISLEQRLAGATTESLRNSIQRQVEQLAERRSVVDQAEGATFSPWHIAISMADIQNADMGNLVTLLHEAAEQLTISLNPSLRGSVSRAIEKTISQMRQRASESALRTGVPRSQETSPTDLLAEALAQQLAAEGIPDAPSLAQAIMRWIKDLYYRVAMAAQRAFGVEPDPTLALNWYENQLRRIVGGDYDYRLARLLDPYMKEPAQENVRRFRGRDGTPGGVSDYFDPYAQGIRQPNVLTDSSEAFGWNVEFRTGTGNQEINDVEARARQHAAAVNRVLEKMEKIYTDSGTTTPWDQWWKLVGSGEDPRITLATIAQKMPGIEQAKIGGDRMTEYIDGLAALEARRLLENIEFAAKGRLESTKSQIEEESDRTIAAAKLVNKIEADRRNADVHEAALQDKLKEMTRRFVQDYSKGLSTAEQHGELAHAIRQAESLLESDPIPEQYQQVFQNILAGKIPIWTYLREIAKLELNLSEMTPAQVRKAIRDNADRVPEFAQLGKIKPLSVALSTLAVKNQAQMDDIALGRLTDGAKYAAIHEELESIRIANDEQLRQLIVQMDERGKARSLRERIRDDYIKRRRDLRVSKERVNRARAKAEAISSALPALASAVEEAQIQGSSAPSEWTPSEGAKFTEMILGADGKWTSRQRTLAFNPDGSAIDGEAIRSALYANNEWLKTHLKKKDGKTWQDVERQTTQLMMMDVQRSNPAIQANKLVKLLAPTIDNVKRIGGNAALRASKMLNDFEFVRFSNAQEVQRNAHAWTKAWLNVQKATGITDNGILHERVYDPVNYFLNTNPGLDEDVAIRLATKQARARLTKEPSEKFTAAFGELLRQTKLNSEHLINIATKEGAFVQDDRLKSGLRRAVAQGWLTNMRSLDGGLVRRIISDMEKAGWKLGFKKVKVRDKERQQVAGATTFADLTAEDTGTDKTQALSALLQKLFPSGIVRDWLEPFINKGGVEVFNHDGEPIAQLDLQDTWQKANGNVLQWIDMLANQVGLKKPEEGKPDPLASFRLSMLQQLDGLFGMEAKLAYEASQTRDLFDPMGPKPHVMMDARLNDTIPSEHLNFALYDPHTAQMLLSEIAFHSKFGRNGEALVQALAEMNDATAIKKAEYESLTGTTERARALEAKARGWDYAELKAAAKRSADVESVKSTIETMMAVGRPGGPFEEVKAGMAFMNTMVGQIVDNPKTGFYNFLSIAERAFAQRSLGPTTIRNTAKGLGMAAHAGLGSIFEAFGFHLLNSSAYFKTVSNGIGGSRNQPWSQALADIGPGGKQGFTERVFIRPTRLLRYIQNKGVGSPAEAREFPRAAPIPGLGVGNYLGQLAGSAGAVVEVMQMEKMISEGIRYFASDREAASNPNFRFKAGDLGLGRFDQGVFDWWRNNTVEYGMGNLEDIVRGAMAAQARGEPLLNKDQVLRITGMAMTEFDGQSSINTTPSFMQENPVLRNMLPLLRWPFWKMNQIHKGMKTADGRLEYAALARGLGTLALWNLPIGLAFTFALDKYDEEIIKKRSNLPAVSGMAAIPLVGPALDLILSDKSIPDTLKAYAVRTARAGNVYGMGSDLIGQIASPSEAASGRRVFSMDQRVLAMSQFLNIQQAISNFAHQDWTATWASVWSPLFRSMGGNGALHALDITNRALGLDNAQSRQVMRINAANWLRAAASEAEIELKTGGGSGTPTPMSVWTREMLTSSMANDRIGFMEAHGKALEAARKVVADDSSVPMMEREREAERRVLAGWRARDPLSIFAQKPTPIQLNQMYSIMDPDGAQDVREALTRYESFTRLIKASPVQQKINQRLRQLSRPQMQLAPVGGGLGPLF